MEEGGMHAVRAQLDRMLARFRAGTLTEEDIRRAIRTVDAAPEGRTQSLLYVQAPSTHPHSAIIGMSIYEAGKDPEGIDEEGNLLYASIKEALDDGWRILKFPEMALAMDEQHTYGLGYEFVLERWR